MNYIDQIDQIIQSRKPIVEKIQRTQGKLEFLRSELFFLRDERDDILDTLGDNDELGIGNILNESINIEEQINIISAIIVKLDRLKKRFGRDTLNIGVVGRMRQGKSTLLRTISGLSEKQIPTASGTALTATRSIIRHSSQVAARVCYYSEQEFMNTVIKPYYEELDLGQVPRTLSLFQRKRPQYSSDKSERSAEFRQLIENYYDHIDDYKEYIYEYQGECEHIPNLDDVTNFVAYYNPVTNQRYYEPLAVKEVQIDHPYRYPDVGKIAFIDMPGLGELKVGIEARLVNTLGEEADIVLIIRRPDSRGDDWKREG